jgi:hypothetical protein
MTPSEGSQGRNRSGPALQPVGLGTGPLSAGSRLRVVAEIDAANTTMDEESA